MKSCYDVLRQSAADLKQIIEGKFDEALAANDVASMERFFKLFPLINEHSSGLKRFGNYLCAKIEKLGEDNFKVGFLYSENLFYTKTLDPSSWRNR